MKPFEFVIAQSEAEVLAQLDAGHGSTVIKAGGIDLIDRMKLGISAPARLVHVGSLPSLHGVHTGVGGLRIGAATTLAQLAGNALLGPRYEAIKQAAGSAANPQIRNVATVGGNLLQRPRCWYYRNPEFECFKRGGSTCYAEKGENRYHAIFGGGPSYIVHPSTMATALSACDARLRIVAPPVGGKSQEREVSLDAFFTAPADDYERENILGANELIAEIVVPVGTDATRSAYRSVKERQVHDWPLAEVAISLAIVGNKVERARIVLGAAAPIPWRCKEAEAALVGQALTAERARSVAQLAMAGAKPLAHNGYKVPMFTGLIEATLVGLAGAK